MQTSLRKKKILPRQIEHNMSSQDLVLAVLVVVIAAGVFFMLDPTMGGLLKSRNEGFQSNDYMALASYPSDPPSQFNNSGPVDRKNVTFAKANASASQETMSPMNPLDEGFANPITPSPMPFAEAEKPANCYPKNQLAPQELLPNDPNSKWAQVNPMGSGDIAGKNFLNAGSLIGVNTVGQSLRNASWDLRSEPPNPQVQVSPWMQSTIEPELQRRPLEIA